MFGQRRDNICVKHSALYSPLLPVWQPWAEACVPQMPQLFQSRSSVAQVKSLKFAREAASAVIVAFEAIVASEAIAAFPAIVGSVATVPSVDAAILTAAMVAD
ncbi:MAG: hypothetical protein CTY31_02920 [Hyphomicrobium sp.]|nr:MAG: hypothetical protein CTY31_02920 [Hyphomicrobium sp.]